MNSSGLLRACSSIRVKTLPGRESDVFGDHAEHHPVDEVRHVLRLVAPLAKRLRELRERCCRALRQRLPALTRREPFRVPIGFIVSNRDDRGAQRLRDPSGVRPDAVRPASSRSSSSTSRTHSASTGPTFSTSR